MVHSPRAAADEALHEYAIELQPLEDLVDLDGLVLAVPHAEYLHADPAELATRLRPTGVLTDVKSALAPAGILKEVRVWSR